MSYVLTFWLKHVVNFSGPWRHWKALPNRGGKSQMLWPDPSGINWSGGIVRSAGPRVRRQLRQPSHCPRRRTKRREQRSRRGQLSQRWHLHRVRSSCRILWKFWDWWRFLLPFSKISLKSSLRGFPFLGNRRNFLWNRGGDKECSNWPPLPLMNLTWYQSVAFCFWIPMLFKLLQHQTLCFPQFWKNYISNPKRFNPYFYPFLYLQHVFPKRGKRGFLKIQPIFRRRRKWTLPSWKCSLFFPKYIIG